MRVKDNPGTGSGESGLETFVSYILIVGVILSLLLEMVGISLYYISYGNLGISKAGATFIQGHDFFTFLLRQLQGGSPETTALRVMTAGIVVLVLTPFVRVVLSVVYFAWEKNWKYVLITVFVLVVLALSLSLH